MEDVSPREGRSVTDINARCGKVLEDIRKGKRTICAGNWENAPRFPEFSPLTAMRHTSKTLKQTPVSPVLIGLIKRESGHTHLSAISCERRKSWEWGRGSGRRERQKEHTETPGVRGEMRTRGPNSHSQQQRRSDTWRKNGGLGGVKVTAWRLQLCHSIKEGCGFSQRGSVGGSVLHVCSQTHN